MRVGFAFTVQNKKQPNVADNNKMLLIPTRIRNARRARDLTQQKVAAALGMRHPGYNSYETGRVTPPPDKLAKLADLFGVTTDYLLGRENENGTSNVGEDAATYKGFTALLRRQLRSKFEVFLETADANQMVALEKALDNIRRTP